MGATISAAALGVLLRGGEHRFTLGPASPGFTPGSVPEATDLPLPTVQARTALSARARRRAGNGLAGDPSAVSLVFRSDLPRLV